MSNMLHRLIASLQSVANSSTNGQTADYRIYARTMDLPKMHSIADRKLFNEATAE
jgi:hypothetical protein